jgi:peptidoglycan/LPS O-acetylase OafA/YrhL
MEEPVMNKEGKLLEIEGLRAVAAMLVILYHYWIGGVSGGVDIFFIVSGFLITTMLVKMYNKDGRVDVAGFVVKLSQRLFPLGFLVLFANAILSVLILPQTMWSQITDEIIASAAYFQNIHLAVTSTDYLAQNFEASSFQHFWAMSIQGQFYLIWGLTFFVTLLVLKWTKSTLPLPKVLTWVFALFTAGSFSFSLYLTAVNPEGAYFNTLTRVWEFGLGGLLALFITKIRVNRKVGFVMGWAGLLLILLAGPLVGLSQDFPGWAALLPTVGGVLIILNRNYEDTFTANRLLSAPVMTKIGGLSYGLYLWHWPLLIYYYEITGNTSVSLWGGTLLIGLSFLLSYVSVAFIENPIRFRKGMRTKAASAVVSGMIALPVVLFVAGFSLYVNFLEQSAAESIGDESHPGAQVLALGVEDTFEQDDIIPIPANAREEMPFVYEEGCHQTEEDPEVIVCTFGEEDNPEAEIAMVGGSHSAHWIPAFEEFVEEHNLKVYSITKSACRFRNPEDEEESCAEWNERLMEEIIEINPDLVFTTADAGSSPGRVPSGYRERWEKLAEENLRVFAIRDNPWFPEDVPVCLERNGPEAEECSVSRDEALPAPSSWEKLGDEQPENVYYADLSDYLCGDDTCGPAYGNVMAYRDSHHISVPYARTLAPYLEKEILEALESD